MEDFLTSFLPSKTLSSLNLLINIENMFQSKIQIKQKNTLKKCLTMFNKANSKKNPYQYFTKVIFVTLVHKLISYISFLNDVNYLDRNPTNKTELSIIKIKYKKKTRTYFPHVILLRKMCRLLICV